MVDHGLLAAVSLTAARPSARGREDSFGVRGGRLSSAPCRQRRQSDMQRPDSRGTPNVRKGRFAEQSTTRCLLTSFRRSERQIACAFQAGARGCGDSMSEKGRFAIRKKRVVVRNRCIKMI